MARPGGFHFLVEEKDRRRYRHVLRQTLAPSATIIVGTFASDGPTYCSGLPVARYEEAELVAALGGGFDTVGTTREEHLTPTGVVQPSPGLRCAPRLSAHEGVG